MRTVEFRGTVLSLHSEKTEEEKPRSVITLDGDTPLSAQILMKLLLNMANVTKPFFQNCATIQNREKPNKTIDKPRKTEYNTVAPTERRLTSRSPRPDDPAGAHRYPPVPCPPKGGQWKRQANSNKPPGKRQKRHTKTHTCIIEDSCLAVNSLFSKKGVETQKN